MRRNIAGTPLLGSADPSSLSGPKLFWLRASLLSVGPAQESFRLFSLALIGQVYALGPHVAR